MSTYKSKTLGHGSCRHKPCKREKKGHSKKALEIGS
jgi:hypothetical protein